MSQKVPLDSYLPIAEILKPFGVRGEVKVRLLCEDYDDFCDCLDDGEVYLAKGLSGDRLDLGSMRRIEVDSTHAHSGSVLVGIVGIDTPERAETLRGQFIAVPIESLPVNEEGEFYFFQLQGLAVYQISAEHENGEQIGTVNEVLENPAHELLVVQPIAPGEKAFSIPLVEAFVRKVDLEAGRIEVTLPDGFIESQK